MTRSHRHSGLIIRTETPSLRNYIYGHTSGAKQVVVMPHAIAHAPIMRVYGTFDGVTWIFLFVVNPGRGVPIEIPHGGIYKAIQLSVVHGGVTFVAASYWI